MLLFAHHPRGGNGQRKESKIVRQELGLRHFRSDRKSPRDATGRQGAPGPWAEQTTELHRTGRRGPRVL